MWTGTRAELGLLSSVALGKERIWCLLLRLALIRLRNIANNIHLAWGYNSSSEMLLISLTVLFCVVSESFYYTYFAKYSETQRVNLLLQDHSNQLQKQKSHQGSLMSGPWGHQWASLALTSIMRGSPHTCPLVQDPISAQHGAFSLC